MVRSAGQYVHMTETKSTDPRPLLSIVPDGRPARCAQHPAFEADYCPSCGTSRVIGRRL